MKFKLPEGWEKIGLGKVIDIISGGTPKRKEETYWNGNIPWISVKDFINEEKYINTTKEKITQKGLENSSTNILEKSDIIISARGTVGKLAIIKYPMAFNQSCYGLRAKKSILSNNYLYYFLKYDIERLKRQGHGSVFNTIIKSTLENLSIQIPPLKEQKAIANILSSLDNKIELNNKINKNLEQQAQEIFKHWFVDFEFPDENGNPYKSSGGKMVESELGEIPEGWEVVKIIDISKDIVLGKTPKTSDKDNFGGEIPFLTIPDMHNKVYVSKTARTLSEKGKNTQPKKTIPENSICVSCIATPGLVTITKEPTQTNQQINTIVPSIEYTYVYSQMKSISNKIISLGEGGTTTNNLNKTQFSNIDIILPNKTYRKKYHDIVENMFNVININQQQNQTLSNLRDTLLPKLMSGELRIPLD